MKHGIVYHQKGQFAGWPANGGMWSWGSEIVLVFTAGDLDASQEGHAIAPDRPRHQLQARSVDGGETWETEKPADLDILSSGGAEELKDCGGGIDFNHSDFAMIFQRSGDSGQAQSWFFYSLDRCKKWIGPFRVPDFGAEGIAARTDYVVENERECLVFLTAIKNNGREGRPFASRMSGYGSKWELLSWICPEPRGYGIMPSTVRLSRNSLLTAVRFCGQSPAGQKKYWLQTFLSRDNGNLWEPLNRPAAGLNNPPAMIRMEDGRICLAYGFRGRPCGIRARISGDDGFSWGGEIMLRDDAGNWDVGYPRTVQRPDGKMLTVYYFNDRADAERYIAFTVWDAA